MSEITLEKIDMIRDRICVSYSDAKEALEVCNGDVLDAIVYLESKLKNEAEDKIHNDSDKVEYESIESFKKWLNDVINKGNVNRIIVKSKDKVIVDVPVNAGVAAGVIAVLVPQLMIIGLVAAVVTEVTIEIVKDDGTVEVVNKLISKAADDITDKTKDIADDIKKKASEVKDKAEEIKNKIKDSKSNTVDNDDHIYSYTVKFDEDDK